MEPRLLELYNTELRHLRGMGGEFARDFPKIAGRLGLDRFQCADPYVERLLEGFAFLAARVQLKLEAEFPRFTQHLLDVVYPHFLATMPAMTVVQFQPDPREGSLADGFTIQRGTSLNSHATGPNRTQCEFRTAHDVTLFPIELTAAEHFPRNSPQHALPSIAGVDAGLRFVLRTTNQAPFSRLRFDRLNLFLRGESDSTSNVYEQMLARAVAVVVRPLRPRGLAGDPNAGRDRAGEVILDKSVIRPVGFRDDEALLPVDKRNFQGYRLLQEYFAFPQRFRFIEIGGLQAAAARCPTTELEIFVLLGGARRGRTQVVHPDDFALHCAPAVNLFPRRADRIHLSDRQTEFHITPDRTRPLDFEVHSVSRVTGHGLHGGEEQEFLPFYGQRSGHAHSERGAYFSLERRPRVRSEGSSPREAAAAYHGSEAFLSLVDAREAPYRSDLRTLSVQTLCTNRNLTSEMPLGTGTTDFTLQIAAPAQSIRAVAGPTAPVPSPAVRRAELGWKLINLLSLNYLSLTDSNPDEGATALREMLALHCHRTDPSSLRQIDGVRHVSVRPVTRRLPLGGPIAFGRGLEVTLDCDDSCFEGSGVFLLGSVLEQFFARYASINSMTETVLRTTERNEVHRWAPRTGRRQTL